ncbi:MAG: DinB family protein [Gemmatimonadaceae bacterium]
MTSGELIADELRSALRGDPWHGPSLVSLVDDLSVEEAVQRPIPAAHNIWELVLHITSWSNIALRRINGGQQEPFDGEDWPEPGAISPERWSQIVAEMSESHERLCEVVAGLSDDRLSELAPGSSRSIAFMLHGIAQHDAYHGGQIALLRKVVTTKHRRAAI